MRCILICTIILASCSTAQLPHGQWSGYVSPMNQPNIRSMLNYEVNHSEENVSLEIYSPGGGKIQTKSLQMTQDSLFFTYDKQEQQGILYCGLKKVNKNYYYGRCTDQEGKWAVFTMKHHSLDKVGTVPHIGSFRCGCHN